MKRTLLVLIAALVTTVMFSGCFWVEDRHDDDRGWHHEHYDRDRDYDRDRH